MGEKQLIGVPVQTLIEYVLKKGDLTSGYFMPSRLLEGAEEHRSLQRSRRIQYETTEAGKPAASYTAEVPLQYRKDYGEFILEVSGRADGLLVSGPSVTIEEIKTSVTDPADMEGDGNPLHWAQTSCYGAMLAARDELPEITLRLTYRRRGSTSDRSFERTVSREDLFSFFTALMDTYADWTSFLLKKNGSVRQSLAALAFPFAEFRAGQRSMAAAVFRTIRDGKRLFAQAPTGIGKTVAVLYPALRALGNGSTEKLFYLTAKTVTRTAAENAVELLRLKGMKLSSITLTAKEKICCRKDTSSPQAGPFCTPELCPLATGYFDRINAAVRDILSGDRHLDRTTIEAFARKHSVCPFEFSLDVSLWCDLIVCDYNYLFDPRASLKRYFQDRGGDYAFLIDEAHNLPDRAREMHSADLAKREILDLKKLLSGRVPKLVRILSELNALFIRLRKSLGEESRDRVSVRTTLPEDIVMLLEDWVETFESLASRGQISDYPALEFTYRASAFLRVAGQFDSRYVTFTESSGHDVRVKLFCLDPSVLIEQSLSRGKSAVFFSATLQPIGYFTRMLGTDPDPDTLLLPSPFPRENLRVLLDSSVSTRWADREGSYSRVAHLIAQAVGVQPGNYLVFFPSFRYLEAVAEVFERLTAASGFTVLRQSPNMPEADRERFLESFTPGNTGILVGFAVMGGIFGEGIDLAGDRLSGAVITGVGLPQVNREREAIRSYFEETTGNGFAFAYTYPGMNRVLQAAGRVIRSETDRGIVLLIDDRFATPQYSSLLPGEWKPLLRIPRPEKLPELLRAFWDEGRTAD